MLTPKWSTACEPRSLVPIDLENLFSSTSFSPCHVIKVVRHCLWYYKHGFTEIHTRTIWGCDKLNYAGFGVGHMRDTKTKGDVIPNFSRLVPCCYLVYFLMEKIMKQSNTCMFSYCCRYMDLGYSCWDGCWWFQSFCPLSRHRRIWKRWEIKCIWWQVCA